MVILGGMISHGKKLANFLFWIEKRPSGSPNGLLRIVVFEVSPKPFR